MKTKTIKKVLRQFAECDADLKEKILNNYRYINIEDFDLTEMNDAFYCNLEYLGFKNPKIHYSISYSQGDGACFDCEEFDFDILLKDLNIKHKTWLIDIIKNYCTCKIIKCGTYNLYSHVNTRDFIISTNYVLNHPRIEKMLVMITKEIESKREQACNQLYYDLLKEYEYLTSDEAITDTLLCNEYYFNEEGQIENE